MIFSLLDQLGVRVSQVFPTPTGQQSFPSHVLYRNEGAASEIVVTLPLLFFCFSLILHPRTKYWASVINNCIDSCFALAAGTVMMYLTFYLPCGCTSYTKTDLVSKPCVESTAPPWAQKYIQATCEGYL